MVTEAIRGGGCIPLDETCVKSARRSSRSNTMNTRISRGPAGRRVMGAVSLAAALLLMSGSIGLAHSKPSQSDHGLVGTWFVEVTLRNCTTNAPMGSFRSLVTFHRGGTVTENTTSPGFAIGQRSSGQGNWDVVANHTYRQRMVSLINFDTLPNLPGVPGFNPALPVTPGFFAGWGTVTHTLKLDGPNHAASAGTNEFFRADGTSYRTGCSTAVAERFE